MSGASPTILSQFWHHHIFACQDRLVSWIKSAMSVCEERERERGLLKQAILMFAQFTGYR